MKYAEIFIQQLPSTGRKWMVQCATMAGVIGAGWVTGQLQFTCVAVIGTFVFSFGLVPFWSLAKSLKLDSQRCLDEKGVLQTSRIEVADKIARVNQADMGSVFLLLASIKNSEGRVGKRQAVKLFLEVAREQWLEMLSPVQIAAEQAPLLGLFGSLLGILSSLNNSAGDISLEASMATMVSTTIIGCAGAFLLIGLAARGGKAVDRHIAELEFLASLILSNFEENEEGNDEIESLF